MDTSFERLNKIRGTLKAAEKEAFESYMWRLFSLLEEAFDVINKTEERN